MKQINKNTGNGRQLIRGETKKHVTQLCRWSSRDDTKKEGLNPIHTTLCKRAMTKQVLYRFQRMAATKSQGMVISKRNQTIHSHQGAVIHLPRKVNDTTVQRHIKELGPGKGPVQITKRLPELRDTVRDNRGKF